MGEEGGGLANRGKDSRSTEEATAVRSKILRMLGATRCSKRQRTDSSWGFQKDQTCWLGVWPRNWFCISGFQNYEYNTWASGKFVTKAIIKLYNVVLASSKNSDKVSQTTESHSPAVLAAITERWRYWQDWAFLGLGADSLSYDPSPVPNGLWQSLAQWFLQT